MHNFFWHKRYAIINVTVKLGSTRTVYDVHITLEISLSKYIIVFLGKEVARMMFLFRCKKKKKMLVVDIAATLQFRNDCARSCYGTLSSSFVGYVNLWLRRRSLLYTQIFFSRSQQDPSVSNSFLHVRPGAGALPGSPGWPSPPVTYYKFYIVGSKLAQ